LALGFENESNAGCECREEDGGGSNRAVPIFRFLSPITDPIRLLRVFLMVQMIQDDPFNKVQVEIFGQEDRVGAGIRK